MTFCTSDLLIIGGGPAGLSAAINGASEGLNIRLLDNGAMLGGQARESSGIENYPGFPEGITGNELMGRMAQQARKFAAGVVAPVTAQRLNKEPDGSITVTCDDYTEYHTKSVLLSLGLAYRRLAAENIGNFIGRGVYYGVPSWRPQGARVLCVVGGANSAGQAAVGLAASGKATVKLLVRKSLGEQMSQYLIDKIAQHPNIEVIETCVVKTCHGSTCLEALVIEHAGVHKQISCDHLYIFIGAAPRTLWLRDTIRLDDKFFVCSGTSACGTSDPGMPINWRPAFYETSMAGVFVAGDVRSGSTKRIATSIGEGAGALQMIHGYLASL